MKINDDLPTADRMIMLSDWIKLHRPRPFTIYGLYDDGPRGEFSGWGLYFPWLEKAFYHNPDTNQTHISNQPAQVYRLLSKLADSRMEWLDHT